MVDRILELNDITVEEAIDLLGTVCSDFILVCYFGGKKIPCFKVENILNVFASNK